MDNWIAQCIRDVAAVTMKMQSDSLYKNAENASGAGIEVRVTRTYDGIGLSNNRQCEWCLERCGIDMPYQKAYEKGAFERHPGCNCLIEYTSKKGEKTYQAGKSTAGNWLSEAEFQKRVNYNTGERAPTPQERIINAAIEMQVRDKYSRTLVDAIIDHHEALQYYSPEEMLRRLERAGYKVLPLSKSKTGFNDLSFENGGGYKILFGGDGIFQYHPAGGRHRIAYWKIRNGEGGLKHYDTAGKEVMF